MNIPAKVALDLAMQYSIMYMQTRILLLHSFFPGSITSVFPGLPCIGVMHMIRI